MRPDESADSVERSRLEYMDERMRFVYLDGASIAYFTEGRGETVLLLHGYPQSSLCWRNQIPGLLRAGYRVIAPDFVGWGKSTKDCGVSVEYNTEIRRLRNFIDRVCGERVHLVGHDYGGFVGLGYAQEHAETLRSFCILNSRAHSSFRPFWYGVFLIVPAVARNFPALSSFVSMRAIHRVSLRHAIRAGCFSSGLLARYLAHLRPGTPGARFYFKRWSADYDVRVRSALYVGLSAMRMPVQILWGDRDVYLSNRIALELRDGIPNARLIFYKGGDHYIVENKADEVLEAILSFLGEVG